MNRSVHTARKGKSSGASCMIGGPTLCLVSGCRQLEAIVRMSESLAKMRLAPFATEADVDEALRLFQVSTLDAAMTGNLAGTCVCWERRGVV